MMSSSVSLLLLALTGVLAVPASVYPDDYTEIVSEKRAALMLDRLLVALHKALREETPQQYERPDRDGPHTAPLRVAEEELNDLRYDEDTAQHMLEVCVAWAEQGRQLVVVIGADLTLPRVRWEVQARVPVPEVALAEIAERSTATWSD